MRNQEEFEYFQHMELLETYGLSSLNFSDFEDLTDLNFDNLSDTYDLSKFEAFDQALLIDLEGDEEEFEEIDQELDYLLDELVVEEDLIEEVCDSNSISFLNILFRLWRRKRRKEKEKRRRKMSARMMMTKVTSLFCPKALKTLKLEKMLKVCLWKIRTIQGGRRFILDSNGEGDLLILLFIKV